MLHIETVEPYTFSLLKQLMKMPELQDLSLVGGIALSLLYGHRKSDDLDLFSIKHILLSGKEFYHPKIEAVLQKVIPLIEVKN